MGKVKSLFAKSKKLISSHKRLSIVILVLILILGYFLFPKNQKPVLTENASIKDVIKTVSVTGKIDSDNSVNLSFQTGGTLDYLSIKTGDTVKKGQLIASLNKDELWASFRQTQQSFTAAKAASDKYYDGHKNNTESFDEKIQRTALDAAQNIAYDNMVKTQKYISNSNLYSPIDGIVTRADVNTAGVNITPVTVFTITNPKSLVFKLEVDQADIGQVEIDKDVQVSLDAFPNNILNLTVGKIDFASHITSSGGAAYFVEANLPINSNYRMGMSGNADIIISEKKQVLTIPESSITSDNAIYKQTGKGFVKTHVKLGLQNDILAEVQSGLSVGDAVAIDPGSVPQNLIIKN